MSKIVLAENNRLEAVPAVNHPFQTSLAYPTNNQTAARTGNEPEMNQNSPSGQPEDRSWSVEANMSGNSRYINTGSPIDQTGSRNLF